MEDLPSRQIMVLGFDLRKPLRACTDSGWPERRRARFLIRPEILCPASVDRGVWPPAIENSSSGGNPLNLWNSVSEILAAGPTVVSAEAESPTLIEIGAVPDERSSRYWHDVFYGYLRQEEGKAIAMEAEDLGYDVADRYLLSGLSNCALSAEELEELRKTWAHRINPLGVFDKVSDAASYVNTCDLLIPEHAPFSAYRIRRLAIK
jgi:hypothetical protein